MSIQWPQTQVDHHVLTALPAHQAASATLKRACARYVTAMNELNKQIGDYNEAALQRQIMQSQTHHELRQLLLQVVQVPFASVSAQTVSHHMPRLLVLERAGQCVNLLREVLDEWEMHNAVSPATQPADAGGVDAASGDVNDTLPDTFGVHTSFFAPWASSLV